MTFFSLALAPSFFVSSSSSSSSSLSTLNAERQNYYSNDYFTRLITKIDRNGDGDDDGDNDNNTMLSNEVEKREKEKEKRYVIQNPRACLRVNFNLFDAHRSKRFVIDSKEK